MPLKKASPFKREIPVNKIPHLYYFESKEVVQPAQIQGNAIVLVGRQDKYSAAQERYRTQAYFVKDQHYYKQGHKELLLTIDLSAAHWQAMMDGRDPHSGKVEVAIDQTMTDSLYGKILKCATQYSFPYKRTQLYLAKDGRSIKLSCLDLDFAAPDAKEDIYPLLLEYLQQQFEPNYNFLTLLYKIKQSIDFAQSIDLYRREGKALGGIFFNKNIHAISIDEMIEQVHQAKGISFARFQDEAETIKKRYKKSKVTAVKEQILSSFIEFYKANLNHPNSDLISRSAVVEAWALRYQAENNQDNPFVLLSQQRCSTPLKKLFNPKLVASMVLFNEFLAAETIPHSLKRLMEVRPALNEMHAIVKAKI